MSLYATGTNGTIHEYIFDDRTNSWTEGSTFPYTDGFSGASTWSEGPSSFLFTVSSSQSLEFWFRDYSAASSDDGNRWQLGPSSHVDLMQNGSVCGQTGVAFQSSSGFIQGSNFTDFTDPGETRWDTSYNISDQAAINGSAVSVWFFYSYAHANPNIMFQAFYQKDGSEIEEAIRTWGPDNKTVPGTWTYNSVPV